MRRVHWMHSTLWLLLILLNILAPTPVNGDDLDELINTALNVCGITEQLDLLVTSILASIPGDIFDGREMRKKAEKYVKDHVKPDDLVATVRGAVRRDFRQDRIVVVIDFYQSRLGRKVGTLQSRILTDRAIREVQEGVGSVGAMPRSRLALVKTILSVENAAAANARLLHSVMKGLADGFIASDEPRRQEVLRTLRSLARNAGSAKSLTEQTCLAAYTRTYRSLSDRELEALASYYNSEAAQWFGHVVQTGTEKAAYKVAKAVGEFLRISRDCSEQNRNSNR